jgi:hypothetical protein
MTNTKRVHQFKAGDIVHSHGAVFRILEDARESQGHRPQSAHLETAHGPSAVAYAKGEWVGGQVIRGYFGPGHEPWGFQGNFLLGEFKVD